MADRNTEVALERFTWRMLSQYVSPWEFERLKEAKFATGELKG